jgi:hypothetical protein
MSVISVRLKEAEMQKIQELSLLEQKEKSAVARELINHGWEYFMIKRYRQGKLSLGALAQRLNVPVSDVIDLLAELGVEAPIEFEDYLKGLNVLPTL